MTEEEKIRKNAQLAVEQLGPLSGLGDRFGYNEESVEWVDGYIERIRAGAEAESEGLINVLSCFLGECIVATYGASWKNSENGWGLDVGGNNIAFPFNKVHKQFQNGRDSGDSILSFFRVIGSIQKHGLPPQ